MKITTDRKHSKHQLQLFCPRPWFTNLDFICTELTFGPANRPLRVKMSLIGKMKVTKNVFGPHATGVIGYHDETVEWTFIRKDWAAEVDPTRKSFCSVWRFNMRLPLGSCPMEDNTHVTMPPSLGYTDKNAHLSSPAKALDFNKDKEVQYTVEAEVTHKDGSTEVLSVPLCFLPTPQIHAQGESAIIEGDGGSSTVNNPEHKLEHHAIHASRNAIGVHEGDLHITLQMPSHSKLKSDCLGAVFECKLVLVWSGSINCRPEPRRLTPTLRVMQSKELMHIAAGTKKPHLIESHKCIGQKLDLREMEQTPWKVLSPHTFRKKISCHFTIETKKLLQPSFESCLMTNAYKLKLELDLEEPGVLMNRHKSMPIEFNVNLVADIAPGSDPDLEFLRAWAVVDNLDMKQVGDMNLVEYFKSDARRPSYSESMIHAPLPAPMPPIPQYTDQTSAAERDREPAWSHKAEDPGTETPGPER